MKDKIKETAERLGFFNIILCEDLKEAVAVCAEKANPGEAVAGDWTNYIKGVIVELAKRDIAIKPFDALVKSNLPVASGMSSSAALEVGCSFAFKEL